MKIYTKLLAFALVGGALCFSSCHKKAANINLNTMQDTVNWVIGESMAQSLMNSGVDIDKELVLRAVEATLNGEKQPIDDANFDIILAQVNHILMEQQQAMANKKQADASAQEEKYFQDLVKNNPKLIKHESGFYYEVVKEGKGRKGKFGEVAVFDYKASFANGQIFDQTYGNRDAITHVIGSPMFQGMQDALCLMTPGSIYRCYFPYQLAFGFEGSGDVPPCTTVVYEIELHSVGVNGKSVPGK